MLSRVIVGSRDILVIAPLATLLGTVLGTAVGLVMGYYRGIVDDVLGRVVEAFLALPLIVTAVVAIAALGTSNATLIIVIGHRVHAADRAHGARRGAAGARPRLRRCRAPARRGIAVHHVRRDPSERVLADRRRVHRPSRVCDLHGADADVPRVRGPAAVARLGIGHRDKLRCGDARATGGRCCSTHWRSLRLSLQSPWCRSRSRECWSDDHSDRTDGQPRSRADAGGRARGRQHRRHLSRPRTPARRRARRLVQDRSWRVLRAGGRIRLREVDDRARRGPLPGAQRLGQRRLDLDRRPRRAGDARRRAAQAPHRHGVDGLPGAGQVAEPDDPGRTPGRRGVRDRWAREGGVPRSLSRDAREGADLRSGRGDEPLSRISSREGCFSAS